MTFTRTLSSAAGALAILASTVAAGSAPMSAAKPSFDRNWSVLIVTEKGTCDRVQTSKPGSRWAFFPV